SLPRLASWRGRQAGRARLPRCERREPSDARVGSGLPGLRTVRPRPFLRGRPAGGRRWPDGWVAAGGTERPLPDRLLRRAGPPLLGTGDEKLAHLRSLLPVDPFGDVPEPHLPACGPDRSALEHFHTDYAAHHLGSARR